MVCNLIFWPGFSEYLIKTLTNFGKIEKKFGQQVGSENINERLLAEGKTG